MTSRATRRAARSASSNSAIEAGSRNGIRSKVSDTVAAIAGNGISPRKKRLHRDLVGGIQGRGRGSAGFLRLIRQLQQRETCRNRADRRSSARTDANRGVGTGASARSGYVRAYWIGMRMSVAEIWAITLPSLNSTMA